MIRTYDIDDGAVIVESVDYANQIVSVRCFVGGTRECVTHFPVAHIEQVWGTTSYAEQMASIAKLEAAVRANMQIRETVLTTPEQQR